MIPVTRGPVPLAGRDPVTKTLPGHRSKWTRLALRTSFSASAPPASSSRTSAGEMPIGESQRAASSRIASTIVVNAVGQSAASRPASGAGQPNWPSGQGSAWSRAGDLAELAQQHPAFPPQPPKGETPQQHSQ
jgi:hypothetical protein